MPILADLSRRHAVIRREAGAYVLEPLQPVRVDGREITGPTVLADNQLIQLGDNVRLRFTKPHALSATARLDFESHHKTQPSADAVLLMADSCVLGPNRHCHVRCRDWQHDVVLYRHGDGSAVPLGGAAHGRRRGAERTNRRAVRRAGRRRRVFRLLGKWRSDGDEVSVRDL